MGDSNNTRAESRKNDSSVFSTVGDCLYLNSASTTPLYEASSLTVLDALVQYFLWFCEHPGISKEALSSLLATQHGILPPGNQLPSSYETALRVIEPNLVQPLVYDACPQDCILFRGEYASLSKCPKCSHGRYVPNGGTIPARRFTYLPLKPRIVRLFGTSNIAQILQSHAIVREHEMERIFDIQQSPAWKKAYGIDGVFEGDSRGISLSLCTDGVNPFAHNRVSYSMWPIMLTLLNLPRKWRNRFASILLVGIVPSNGPQEAHSLNPYLDVLVDELLELSSSTVFDAYQKAPFRCKVALLLHVLDYPGIAKVMSVVGSGGFQGCAFCELQGERNENLHKTVYLQSRRYLQADSALRKDTRK